MRRCITTLPITPKADPCINLVIQPFVMDVLGIKMGLKRILSLSSCGIKSNNGINPVADYIISNKQFGIQPDIIWRDCLEQNISLAKKLVNELFYSGYILQEETELIKCPCGVVESLAIADNLSSARKKYNNGTCIVCCQKIFKTKETALLFQFPDCAHSFPIETFPKFYEKDIRNMFRRFSGYKFLISRSRTSSFSLEIKGTNALLDVDFVWQLFLSSLYRHGYDTQFLVGSNKNLMACLFSIILFNILDKKNTIIVIPPFCFAPNRHRLNVTQHRLSFFLEKYDIKTIRLLLSTAMNWKIKESIIDFELLDIIKENSYRIESLSKNDSNIREVASVFNKQAVKKILALARKSKGCFKSKELFGII